MGSQISSHVRVQSCHFVFALHENIEYILSIWMKRLEYGVDKHYITTTPG